MPARNAKYRVFWPPMVVCGYWPVPIMQCPVLTRAICSSSGWQADTCSITTGSALILYHNGVRVWMNSFHHNGPSNLCQKVCQTSITTAGPSGPSGWSSWTLPFILWMTLFLQKKTSPRSSSGWCPMFQLEGSYVHQTSVKSWGPLNPRGVHEIYMPFHFFYATGIPLVYHLVYHWHWHKNIYRTVFGTIIPNSVRHYMPLA